MSELVKAEQHNYTEAQPADVESTLAMLQDLVRYDSQVMHGTLPADHPLFPGHSIAIRSADQAINKHVSPKIDDQEWEILIGKPGSAHAEDMTVVLFGTYHDSRYETYQTGFSFDEKDGLRQPTETETAVLYDTLHFMGDRYASYKAGQRLAKQRGWLQRALLHR